MTALGLGLHALLAGAAELVICGGLESASTAPPERTDRQEVNSAADASSQTGCDQLQAWARQSLARYRQAEAAGWFAAEHGTIEGLASDECPRSDAAAATLAPLADGAAFLLLATARKASKLGLQPLARLGGYAQLAGEPTADDYLPVRVIRQLMRRQGRAMYEIDLLEIHEGSAATAVESTLQLGSFNPDLVAALRERTNTLGGALAIGHAPGASGARMTMTLVNALARRGQGRGIAAISGGSGQAEAVIVEVPAT
jgi:acetyl-CoA C-acetyltransferase